MANTKTDLYYYNNPAAIQQDILDRLSNISGGKDVGVDPNTTLGFLLDSFTTITSNITKGIENKLNGLYTKRAQSMEDLYNHISDFDYVSFQAEPASTTLQIIVPKKIIYDTVINYDDYYDIVIIPKDTIFKIGTLDFKIYFNILIKVNKVTKNIIIDYDTTEDNPLNKIDNYNIPYSEFKFNEITYLSFEIPIYQFGCEYSEVINIDPSVGFLKKYKLEDKFYAVRIFDIINGTELSYSMSDIIYDPLKATCIVKYLSDTKELLLTIPQVYFSSRKVSNQLYAKIYTTKGKLDIYLDTNNTELIKAIFKVEDAITDSSIRQYVEPLTKIKSMVMVLTDPKIVGGKNEDSFDTIKNDIIYDLYSDRVLINTRDVKSYFEKYGFRAITRVDNLTDRIFYISNHISDKNNNKLLINNSKIILDIVGTEDGKYMDSIRIQHHKRFTIMPNTIYEYEIDRNLLYPIDQDTYNQLNYLSLEQKVDFFNNDKFFFYPYHLVVDTSTLYPTAVSYDLLDIDISNFRFGDHHYTSTYQMYVNDFQIYHLEKGCGGYKISFAINKNDALKKISENDIELYLYIRNTEDKLIGKKLTFESSLDQKTDIYSVILNSNYFLNKNQIELTDIQFKPEYFQSVPVPLETDIFLTLNIKSKYLTEDSTYQPYNIFENHPLNEKFLTLFEYFHDKEQWIPIERYDFNIRFGTNLSDIMSNNITINYSEETYSRYENDVVATYEHDIYEKDSNGKLVFTISDGKVHLNKIHSAGDVIYNKSGNVIYKHRKGDIKLTNDGKPIVLKPREIISSLDVFGISYKHLIDSNFDLYDTLDIIRSYFSSIRKHRSKLYGNTLCFFKPISTIGKGIFYQNAFSSVGNSNQSIIELKLNIKVGFKIYTNITTINDEQLIDSISNGIISIIKDHLSDNTFNLVSIGDKIVNSYREYIKFVDVKGINDIVNLQSLTKAEDNQDIIIDKYLELEKGVVTLKDNVDLEFIPVE